MLRLLNFVPLILVLPVSSAAGQIAQKPPIVNANSIVQRNAELAENGQCLQALPQLKKNAPEVTDKDLKRRAGLDGVHCAMTLNRPEEALDFLQFLAREFPKDPEVLYVATHAYSEADQGAPISSGSFVTDGMIVRVDPAETGALTTRPGVGPFVMGGRSTRGFVLVAGEALDDADLAGWIDRARTYVATLPPK